MTKFWEYRAINQQLQIVNGTAQAQSFIQLSIDLRQRQLQVIEANQIHRDKMLANDRLQAMKRTMVTSDPKTVNKHASYNTSHWLFRIMRFLLGS